MALKIYREFCSKIDGSKTVSVETITDSLLADAYLKIKETKSTQDVAKFVWSDRMFFLERQREKRRLQDKLRRIKRKQALEVRIFHSLTILREIVHEK